jgi:MFS family permease
VLTSVAFFMTAVDSLVAVTALPAIHAGLAATMGWTVNAYMLPFAVGIIIAAAFGDRSRCVHFRRTCVDAEQASSEPSVRRLA